jgi:hypothetical protein
MLGGTANTKLSARNKREQNSAMRIKLLITSLLMIGVAQSQTLIPDAQKMKVAFDSLSVNINSKVLQENYIAAFPADTKTFLSVFQTEKFDQLYMESDKYLSAFEMCSKSFPSKVISKCIDIGKNLVWDADAVGQLQHMSVYLANKHLKVFVSKYKTLNGNEQNKLIAFYADVENFSAYQMFQDLIDQLNSIGEKEIAMKLDSARAIRKKNNHH